MTRDLFYFCILLVIFQQNEVDSGNKVNLNCIQDQIQFRFFKKNLEDISPFSGATNTPVLAFWWCLLWVSKPEWTALIMLDGGTCVTHSLSFTSGATPSDLLVASMAAKPFSSMYLWAGIGRAQNWDLSCHCHLTVCDQPDALPTELCRLGFNSI